MHSIPSSPVLPHPVGPVSTHKPIPMNVTPRPLLLRFAHQCRAGQRTGHGTGESDRARVAGTSGGIIVTCYWDTSALVNAAVNASIRQRLAQHGGITRIHALAEFFGQMTNRGVTISGNRVRFEPKDVARWWTQASREIQFIELDPAEIIQAFQEAQQPKITGARIYDYLHGKAALKGKAGKILTRDKDFQHLGLELPSENWPKKGGSGWGCESRTGEGGGAGSGFRWKRG